MLRRIILLLSALTVVLAVPFILRQSQDHPSPDARRLVIVSPHNEAIRYEFDRAFRNWHQNNFGEAVAIDWRNIGGTSEIARYIDSEFEAAGRVGRQGIGIDLLFGGGQFDHARQAARGQLAPAGIRERRPEWLQEDIIPRIVSGEILYDSQDTWYGACLSAFGIAYNTDSLEAAGIGFEPSQWIDLAHPLLRRRIALADPSKSGSINKAFEMLIQQQMSGYLANHAHDPDTAGDAAMESAWITALDSVRRIAANARYFTDSASKVTHDIAQGNAAAGMCIDFYGRFQAENITRFEHSDRMRYVTPEGGSSISADPVAILRGAPDHELAQRFVEFALSIEGQKLWNYRIGEPGGPERYALRRMPIRRDLYTEEHRARMSDAEVDPYAAAAGFTYRPQWTGRLFHLIRVLIRAMCMDTHQELTSAWQAIMENGGPEAQPEAMAAWRALPPNAGYLAAQTLAAGPLRDKIEEIRISREWILFFRARYKAARRIAESSGR